MRSTGTIVVETIRNGASTAPKSSTMSRLVGMADDARVFDVTAQFELRELLPFGECLTQLNGLRSLILIAAAPDLDGPAVVANLAVARLVYGIQLEIVLSLSTHAGGVPGQGRAVMERIPDLLVGFQQFYRHDATLSRRDEAYEFLGERIPDRSLHEWDAHRWSAAGALPDITGFATS